MYSANVEWSGKFLLMDRMLSIMRRETDDRIVIVSNYTQTLDVFSQLCQERNYPFVRLDGSTSAKKRQALVDRLNNPHDDVFVFLLSSRAGGCGLNLIGANRLVLFDPDWNPAVSVFTVPVHPHVQRTGLGLSFAHHSLHSNNKQTDKQAAARVWRDGQKKRTYVYRFVASGTIEELIYQRQLSKEGLQSVVADDQSLESSFSSKDLRDLFRYQDGTISDTHHKNKCTRCDTDKLSEFAEERFRLGNPVQAVADGSWDAAQQAHYSRGAPLASSSMSEPVTASASGPGRSRRGFVAPRAQPKPAVKLESDEANRDNIIPERDHPDMPPDVPQLGYPGEGDLNEWSHHLSACTCDDYVLRKAGASLVSFVFGQTIDAEGLLSKAALEAGDSSDVFEDNGEDDVNESESEGETDNEVDGDDEPLEGGGGVA